MTFRARPGPSSSVQTGVWIVALLVVLVAAKVALFLLLVADGGGGWPGGGWTAIALLHEDLRLVGAFALVVAAAAIIARRRPFHSRLARVVPVAITILYLALSLWTALNVPVARQLASPLTYSFLHATGGAISDSIGSYVTVTNIGVPLAIVAIALWLPRALSGRVQMSPRHTAVAALTGVFILVLGPVAVARTDTRGAHRNAVLTLLETTMVRQVSTRGAPFSALSSPACRASPDLPDVDLSDLVGIARDRNIVWVILESTGARALTTYGAAREAMPNIDALAANAVVFENAYAAYPESIKGLFSFLCSRAPPQHAEASELDAHRAPCRTPAQQLARAGYRTGLFHSGWFAYLGMQAVVEGRGFGQLVDAGAMASPHRSSFGIDDRATAQRLLTFVDQQPRDQKFFAVFMPIAGHHPYHAPGPTPRPFAEVNDHQAYLNDLFVADDAFGLLRAGLQARGLDQKTVYVVIGDHGEAFREHPGNVAHALFVYEENVRVPFFIAAPSPPDNKHVQRQRRVPQLASLVDLAPTTLALAGVSVPPEYEGRSLLGEPPRVARFFTEQGAPRWGMRDGRWKFILSADTNRAQLFDLQEDPGEQVDLSRQQPGRLRRYRACLGKGD